MSDNDTTVRQLRAAVEQFVAERDWLQFHNAKDLAISISLEAAELLEEFQWLDASGVAAASADPEARSRIRFELADIVVYCLCLSNALEMDVSDAVVEKLKLAGEKYRQDEFRGRAPRR
ncbi:MAG: nucleotide pyrophosphohydrolase [Anaerolineae bacterium]|jgi:NTP pyrophosphatase (non-canonical NTP hydrolase)|nr:nucleotide pyrophosphohydrolase [Anaerolineae bacterium]